MVEDITGCMFYLFLFFQKCSLNCWFLKSRTRAFKTSCNIHSILPLIVCWCWENNRTRSTKKWRIAVNSGMFCGSFSVIISANFALYHKGFLLEWCADAKMPRYAARWSTSCPWAVSAIILEFCCRQVRRMTAFSQTHELLLFQIRHIRCHFALND